MSGEVIVDTQPPETSKACMPANGLSTFSGEGPGMPDIVIIGGGVTGVATAMNVARAGASVTLLEARQLAAMASGWTLGGVRQSGRHPAELPIARAAVALWPTLTDDLGADVEYRQKGNLRLARTPEEVSVIRDLVRTQHNKGLDLEFLADNAAVRAVAPAISPSIMAASFCPTDGHANPMKTVQAFAQAARRAGAVIREGVNVTAIETRGAKVTGVVTSEGVIAADRVVVAAGMHAPALLRPLGLDLPYLPQIVTVLQTVPIAPVFEQVFGVANADCAGRQETDGRLRVTTGIGPWTGDLEGWRPEQLQPTAGLVAAMIRRIAAILPVLNDAGVAAIWGGLIDQTPDALPVIEASADVEGLTIAAGFSGHGFGIAPMVGRLVAELALGQSISLPLDAFRLARFAARAVPVAPLMLHG
ncbi:MAG: FAD-binding oxidoreductase [Alphaproteobacteria bacterium]